LRILVLHLPSYAWYPARIGSRGKPRRGHSFPVEGFYLLKPAHARNVGMIVGATQTLLVDLVHQKPINQNATRMTIVELVHRKMPGACSGIAC
jgi:hypothetical protein